MDSAPGKQLGQPQGEAKIVQPIDQAEIPRLPAPANGVCLLTVSNLLDSRLASAESGEKMPERPASYLGSAMSWAVTKAGAEPGGTVEREFVRYGSGFVKTVPLFMLGKRAAVLTAILYAADEMRPGDSYGAQGADLLLGTGKGLGTKALFAATGDWKVNPAIKGLVIGNGSRLLETGLSRHTYVDHKTNLPSWDATLSNYNKNVFNFKAAATDVVLFSAAHGSTRWLNSSTNNLLDRSRMANVMATGGTFGLFSGSLEELERQHRSGEPTSYLKVLGRGLLKGGLDTVAAIPGGLQARSLQRSEATKSTTAADQTTPKEVVTEQINGPQLKDIPIGPAENFAGLSKQLGPTRSAVEKLPAERDTGADPMHAVETPVRVQTVLDAQGRPLAEIVMSEPYAKQLESVQQIRRAMTGAPPELKAALAKQLAEHPLRDRMLPEDVVHHLQQQPDRSINRVILHDGPNPFDSGRNIIKDGVADIGRSGPGEITIFKTMSSHPSQAESAGQGILHEWGHELQNGQPILSRLYESVAPQEPANHRPYAEVGQENWTVNLTEGLLNPNASVALAFARQAPVKNLVLTRGLLESLNQTPAAERTPTQKAMYERALQLQADLTSRALNALAVGDYKATAILQIAGVDAGMAILRTRPHLELAHSGATDSTVAQLAGLSHFRSVDLRGNPGITDASAPTLRSWSGLEKVDVTGTSLTGAGLREIARLPKLSDLNAGRTKTGDTPIFSEPPTGLERLNLARTGAGDVAIAQLEVATRLRWLMLDGTSVTDASIPVLARLKALESLNIYQSDITPDGAARLRGLLPDTKIAH